MKAIYFSLLFCFALLLNGCASKPPTSLTGAPAQSPTLKSVQMAPKHYLNSRIIWGGSIARLETHPQTTHIEVVARGLSKEGKPNTGDQSEGRFIAHINGFLDPAIYADGRSLTVIGKLQHVESRKLGKMSYPYPIVQVESHHLWPQEKESHQHGHDPFFYDPWYPFGYPYYPYRYWPYY